MTARRFYAFFFAASACLLLSLCVSPSFAQETRAPRPSATRGVATLGGDVADFDEPISTARPIPTAPEGVDATPAAPDDSELGEFPDLSETPASALDAEEGETQAGDAASASPSVLKDALSGNLLGQGEELVGSTGFGGALKLVLVTALFALASTLLLMTTSYARISIALSFVRQGLGAGQVPSNQVIIAFSILLTALVMAPVGTEIYDVAVAPYQRSEITGKEAIEKGVEPLRDFLCRQIERSGNGDAITLLAKHMPNQEEPQYYEDASIFVVAPAFLLSELKTAFLIGFQILLPFLIVDLVVSTVLVASGMMMLPPALVSLPFKLALFVMVDGWTLVVKSLLESFA